LRRYACRQLLPVELRENVITTPEPTLTFAIVGAAIPLPMRTVVKSDATGGEGSHAPDPLPVPLEALVTRPLASTVMLALV